MTDIVWHVRRTIKPGDFVPMAYHKYPLGLVTYEFPAEFSARIETPENGLAVGKAATTEGRSVRVDFFGGTGIDSK